MKRLVIIGLIGCGLLMSAGPGFGIPEPPGWSKKERKPVAASVQPSAAPSQPAVDPVGELEAAYLRGEYALVVANGQRWLQETAATLPAPDHRDHIWYLVGMAQLQLQQPEEARRTWESFLDQSPDSRWRPDAEAGVADAVWMGEDPERAIALYQAILNRWGPEHPIAWRLQYQLGQAARQAGQWAAARQAFEALVAKAPLSFEAGLARALLQEAEFSFSVQVGAFGVRDNAVRLQRQLSQRGYSAAVDRTLADGRVLHRVRVGRFPNRAEALQTADRLRQDGFPSKVVP